MSKQANLAPGWEVDEELNNLQGSSFCAGVSRVADSVASDGGVNAVGVFLLGSDFTYHFHVCDFVAAASRYVGMHNRAEGVHAFNALLVWQHRVLSNALAQASEFVSIGYVPNVLVWWMMPQCGV